MRMRAHIVLGLHKLSPNRHLAHVLDLPAGSKAVTPRASEDGHTCALTLVKSVANMGASSAIN